MFAHVDSIAAAIAKAAPLDAEIVIVDNGSTDNTSEIVKGWATASGIPVQALTEPRAGKGRALNLALQAARGELLAFIDDDCRFHPEHVNDHLRHDAADTELLLRGGRIELGDPTDLPMTINITPTVKRWSRALNSARHHAMNGIINGCNMTMRRALFDRLGPFDENFGPGGPFSGDDTEYIFRAYAAGTTIEYVPDMAVSHYHGRKTTDAAWKLWRHYMIGQGAIFAKYFFKHPSLARPYYWDTKNAIKEILTRSNTCFPEFGFSHGHKVRYETLGAIRYLLLTRKK